MPVIKNPRQLGGLLVERRKHLKLSQAQVAEKLGLRQSRLSQLEARPETLTIDQLLVLLRVLGLEMEVRDQTARRSTRIEW